jgi:hypothetical protein
VALAAFNAPGAIGWTMGGGLSYRFRNNLEVFGQYMYAAYTTHKTSSTAARGPCRIPRSTRTPSRSAWTSNSNIEGRQRTHCSCRLRNLADFLVLLFGRGLTVAKAPAGPPSSCASPVSRSRPFSPVVCAHTDRGLRNTDNSLSKGGRTSIFCTSPPRGTDCPIRQLNAGSHARDGVPIRKRISQQTLT